MAVVFKDQEVAKKYEACRQSDGKVHIPSGKEYGSGYAGPLSLITLKAADKAFANGSNILKLKEKTGKPAEKPEEPK